MNQQNFPWRYTVLNGIVLSVVLVAGILSNIPFTENDSAMDAFGALMFSIVLCLPVLVVLFLVSLAYQGFVYRLFRRFVGKRIIWLPVFLVPAALIAGMQLYSLLPSNEVEPVLAAGRLSDLPPDATEVKVYSWAMLFSGTHYLKFRASPESIEDFLLNSPSLSGVAPKVFSSEHRRIPFPDDYPESPEQLNEAEFFQKDETAPDWFSEALRDRGRVFEIPAISHHNWGQVIVDDVNNVVFIRVIWS